jgi:hypothetical protein
MKNLRCFFIDGGSVGICFILLSAGLGAGRAWAQATNVCGPAPAVKAALDQLPRQTPAQPDWQFHQQYEAALHSLMRQYPDDVFVHRAYIRAMTGSDKDEAIAEYKARHEQNPDSAELAYL